MLNLKEHIAAGGSKFQRARIQTVAAADFTHRGQPDSDLAVNRAVGLQRVDLGEQRELLGAFELLLLANLLYNFT